MAGERCATVPDETIDRAAARHEGRPELDALLLETASVEAYLEDFAAHAADHVGPGTHCGITLRHRGRDRRAASSDPRVSRCDEAEMMAGSGPCITAAATREAVLGIDLARDERWPEWRTTALDAGFRSAVAIPAQAGPDAVVALNLYSDEPDPWTPEMLTLARMFAEQVGRVVALCLRITEQTVMNADLAAAMASRSTIDQAIGVIMAQSRCGPDEAFEFLRRASSHRNEKLRDVAAVVVRKFAGTAPSATDFRPRRAGARAPHAN
jgi:hypothetical protein